MSSNNINLKAIRKALNMSQLEVANRLGIQVPAYSKIERGEVQLTVDRLFKLSDLFELSLDEIINYPNRRKFEDGPRANKNVTYIPVAAQAGLLNDFSQHPSQDLGVQFSLPVFYEEDLFLINLEGDSMYPTFCNGDYVLVRQLGNNYQIKWGEPYLIITKDGQVVKRVMKSHSNKNLLLKSDNELYQSYELDESIICSIWEVKGVISKNLAPRLSRQA
ncbi:MAG: helix-turn-helix domain-containing protein [Cyclobacteriaceae bacterium]